MTRVAEWANVTLGELLHRIEAGRSFGGSSRPAHEGEWGIVKVSAMTYGRFRADENKVVDATVACPDHEIHPGDLLVSRANTRDYVGASVLVPNDCRPRLLLSDKSLRLHVKPDIDRRWLWYALTEPSARRWLGERSTGVKQGMRNISQQTLMQLPLLLPSLDEQRRIVEILDDHLSRLEVAEGALAAAARQTAAMEMSVLSRAYAGQRLVGLTDVVAIQGGIQKQPKRQPKCNSYPFLRVANVTASGLDLSDVHRIELFNGELERLRLERGDLLVVEGNGSASQIGRAALWDGSIADCVHQNHLIRLRPRPNLLPGFLEAIWNSPQHRRQLTAVASSTSGLYTLSVSKLARLQLPVPPLKVQERTLERIENVRGARLRLDATIATARKRSAQLRRSMLAAGLTGQLTSSHRSDEVVEEALDV